MKANLAVLAILAGVAAVPAYGRDGLECNKKQTRCLTETKDLTVGDQVGIFNDDGELVATGEVKGMRGDRRAVLINKKHGSIRRGYNLALLEGQSSDASVGPSYKIYREPAKLAAGGSLGYSSISIGEGSPATEMSMYAQWRKWGGLLLIARGVYTATEGEVSYYTDDGLERAPISMSGVGLLGGIGYTLRDTKPISFRGELGLGTMWVNASIDGDPSMVDEVGSKARVKNGFGAYGRGSIGAVWNLSDWHLHADLAESLVYEALAYTLAFGVSKDVK